MKKLAVILLLFFVTNVSVAQSELVQRIRRFHELLVEPAFYIDTYLHDSLSYGHSNGWIENKKEFLSDLGTVITYHAIIEDSMHVSVSKGIAYARFVADIDATMNGKKSQFHLRVLEIWVKEKKTWKLFARQAVK